MSDPSAPERPTMAIIRLRDSLATYKSMPATAVDPDTRSFMSDLKALMDHMDRLEALETPEAEESIILQ